MRVLVVSIADPIGRANRRAAVPLAVRLGCRLVMGAPSLRWWVRETEPGQLEERCAAHS